MNILNVDQKLLNVWALNKKATNTKSKINNPQTNPVLTNTIKPSIEHLKANFLSFGKTPDKPKVDTSHLDAINYLDKESSKLWDATIEQASKSNSDEISALHFIKAAVLEAQLNLTKGIKKLTPLSALVDHVNPKVIGTELTELALEIEFEEMLTKLDKEIAKLPKNQDGPSKISTDFVAFLDDAYKAAMQKWDGFNNTVSAESILLTIAASQDVKNPAQKIMLDFLHKVNDLHKVLDEKKTVNSSSNTASTTTAIMKAPKIKLDKAQESLNTYATHGHLFNFQHYHQKAKAVANVVSSGKNANFIFPRGTKPEYIAHTFASMLNKGEFKDLTPDNTEVTVWDMNKMLVENSGNPPKDLLKLSQDSAKDGKHRVVFIKDFHYMLMLNNFNAASFFNSGKLGDNVHVIGLTQDDIMKELTEPMMGKKKSIELSWQNAFEEISIMPPSPKQAKEMLLKDSRLVYGVLADYPGNVTINEDAVEKLVDVAVTSRKGALPGKALDLLDLVTAAKFNQKGKVDTITKKDVVDYLSLYPEFRQAATSDGGKFALIADTGIKMKDVGGAAQAKDVVEELLDFIKNPDMFAKTGAKIPKGILLSGTPGNGKTYLAKAIAGEAGVPFISVSGSEFVEKYVGVGASRVREVFEFARNQARALAEPGKKGTAIIFIDEFDALGRKRGTDNGGGGREAEQTLNQLLVEMDGLNNNDNVNIIVLAATNRPDLLDDALTERPGRFDHKINVPNPANDPQARYEILSIHARSKKIDGDREQVLKEVADRTSGSSGARLADIINKACIIAAKDGREALTVDDLIEAKLESIAGRINKTNKPSWYRELVVAHECGHALTRQVLLNMAKEKWHKGREIDTITTDSRGDFGGAVFSMPGENETTTFESLFTELVSGYGGYSVEKGKYGMKGSWGISSDLKQTKELAVRAVTQMGMGPKTGLDIPLDNGLTPENREDVKLLVGAAAKVSDLIVDFHKDFLEQYVNTYKTNAGKGGNNLSGNEFKTKLANWYKESGRLEQLKQLEKQISEIMLNTQKGETEKRKKIGFIQTD
ncbi:MAG: AAA family ATPase [Cyanobacteriota bacterium]